MDQKVFDTRQKAQKLLDEAMSIWRQGNHSDKLEALYDDPVFQLLISAVAYQSNLTEGEIERLKTQVLDEFAELLVPYNEGHATPASSVVCTMPAPGVGEVTLNSTDIFTLNDGALQFIPILRTKVISVQTESIVRLDGRRWEVTLSFEKPINDLSNVAFAIRDHSFRDIHIYLEDKEIPLIRPWEYSDMPYSDCFSIQHESYNGTTIYDPSMIVLDMLAHHDIRMYCVRKHTPTDILPEEVVSLKLVVEFQEVAANFCADFSKLILNPVILTNINVGEVSLDSEHPIACISGASENGSYLMQVLKPDKSQLFSDTDILIRKVAADRFNQASLTRLLSSMLGKIHTDYYAFSQLNMEKGGSILEELERLLRKMTDLTNENPVENVRGTYVMLSNPRQEKGVSVSIRYLTTQGARSALYLNEKSIFNAPGILDNDVTRQIAVPFQGSDEYHSNGVPSERLQYFIQTGNRIVTPSDIRKFCYMELVSRYGIMSNMVKSINISHRIDDPPVKIGNASGYVIAVSIEIQDTPFVRRSFEEIIPQAELLMEKMMQVRSASIYPIIVDIKICK